MAQLDKTAEFDRTGVVREAYRIEGIEAEAARSIFLDWVLSLPETTEQAMALRALYEHYGRIAPNHPMTIVLRAGLEQADKPKRRGGRLGRRE